MESTLPMEIIDAARVDGSGEFYTFNRIILPMLKPALVVQMIFSFVESWNNYFLPALLLDKAEGCSVQVQVELHPSVDGVLSRLENVVTTDAIILDKCGSWYNLNRGIIEEAVPEAWVLRLEPSYI